MSPIFLKLTYVVKQNTPMSARAFYPPAPFEAAAVAATKNDLYTLVALYQR